jgi:hypothetical protein
VISDRRRRIFSRCAVFAVSIPMPEDSAYLPQSTSFIPRACLQGIPLPWATIKSGWQSRYSPLLRRFADREYAPECPMRRSPAKLARHAIRQKQFGTSPGEAGEEKNMAPLPHCMTVSLYVPLPGRILTLWLGSNRFGLMALERGPQGHCLAVSLYRCIDRRNRRVSTPRAGSAPGRQDRARPSRSAARASDRYN